MRSIVSSHMLALEPRLMYDGAAAATAAHAAPDAAAKALIPAVPPPVEVQAANPSQDNGKTEVVFVDTSLANYKALEAAVKPGVEIEEISGGASGLAQIAEWAGSHSGYDTISVIGHGSEASLQLGTDTITDASLSTPVVQAELAEIGSALKAGGQLEIYADGVGQGGDGQQLTADLAATTGATVGVFGDPTDATGSDGNWTLDMSSGAIEVQAADPALDGGLTEVVFVDSSVAGYQALVAAVHPGIEVDLISGSQDGLAQMAQWAETHSGYDSISVISHGGEAALMLGTDTVTESSLSNPAIQAELAGIGGALKPGGDLLLYGCDIAQGTDGQQFVSDLATDTGAVVAASTHPVGAAGLGGSWTLDDTTGTLSVAGFDAPAYSGLLDVYAQFNFSSAFNADVVDTTTGGSGNGVDGWGSFATQSYFNTNYSSADPGLPDNGQYAETTGQNAPVQMGWSDSASGNNAWRLTGTGSNTFDLSSGQQVTGYHTLQVYTMAAGVSPSTPAYFQTTLLYSDGSSTTTGSITAPDWGAGASGLPQGEFAITGTVDRVSFNSLNTPSSNYIQPGFNIYGINIAVDPTKTLTGITLTVTKNQADFVFFGATAWDYAVSSYYATPLTYVSSAAQSLSVDYNTATSLIPDLHASDTTSSVTDTWSVLSGSGPSHGTLTFTSATASSGSGSTDITPGGTITYTPTAGYSGTDQFTIQVNDGTNLANKTFNVTVDTPPAYVSAAAQSLAVDYNSGAVDLKTYLHAGDTDTGQTETWTQSAGPSHGTLSFSGATASSGSADITPGGTITYTPTASYSGTDQFTIQVSDGHGGSITKTFNVTVDTPPAYVSAAAQSVSLAYSPGTVDLKTYLHAGDTDTGQTETWSQSSGPSHGTLSLTGATASSGSADITPGGTTTYTPTAGYSGSDQFTIQVSDGHGGTVTKTFNVTIAAQAVIPPPPPPPPPAPTVAQPPPTPAPPPPAAPAPLVTIAQPAAAQNPTIVNLVAVAPPTQVSAPATITYLPEVLPAQAGGNGVVVIDKPIEAVNATGGVVSFQVPSDAFAVTQANVAVTLSATQANGQPLPSWLSFNSQTGDFEGTPPPGAKPIDVKVTAHDSHGHEATQVFKINTQSGGGGTDAQPLGRAGGLAQAGRPGLAAQLHAARHAGPARMAAVLDAARRTHAA